jgi:hypothetical protein
MAGLQDGLTRSVSEAIEPVTDEEKGMKRCFAAFSLVAGESTLQAWRSS